MKPDDDKEIRKALEGWRKLPLLRDAIELYQTKVEPSTFRDRVIEAIRVDLAGAWDSQDRRDRYLTDIVAGRILIGS